MNDPGRAVVAEAFVTLDLRGLVCPHVLSKIVEALEAHPESDLEFLTDHPTSLNVTVPAYCASRGLELRTVWVEGPVHRMGIRRASPDATREKVPVR